MSHLHLLVFNTLIIVSIKSFLYEGANVLQAESNMHID